MEDFPRRNQPKKMVRAERAVYDAIWLVEEMPTDQRLAEAVTLLQQAKDKISDFVDALPESTKTGG